MSRPQKLPTGTVTFLFTDIQGSTVLVKTLGAAKYAEVLEEHGRVLREAFAAHDGIVLGTEGDSFFCVFRLATQALAATIAAQEALAAHSFPHGATVRVRMGMHTGEGALGAPGSGVDYVGFDVHRAARIAAAGHGGQVLLSETTEPLCRDRLPTGIALVDLGLHRFKDLGRPERVFQVAIPGLAATFPRIKSLDRTPNSLPSQLTSFIGREAEIAEGVRLLATTRLLTLTGPGGTGKTRLSLQIAAAAADDFPDGVHFVALASIVDPDLVVPTIARDLGVQLDAQSSPIDKLVDHLGDKKVLAVLDNFEQILAAAPALSDILRRAPNFKGIVSSRAALRVYGEQEMPVPPLALPDPKSLPDLEALSQFEAVRLFVERARAARPDFAVTNENAPAVAGICARLDGLPLAIELAAARIRALGPQAIFARQQTLRGAIAWSYDLLDAPARRLLSVLSWFAGGAALAEVEAVAGDEDDVLSGLERLVEHSLVRQREEQGEPRYFQLQTVRDFGLERLADLPDAAAIRKGHAEAYALLGEAHSSRLMSRDRTRVLDRLELEIDNFRTALDWSIGVGEPELAARLAVGFWRVWQARGYLQEARAVIGRVLALTQDVDSAGRAAVLEAAGGLAYWQGDMVETRKLYERALAICRRLGDERAIANACYNLSFTGFIGAEIDLDLADTLSSEALTIFRRLGDRSGIAKVLWVRGQLHDRRMELDACFDALRESISHFRGLDDPFGLGWALHTIGLVGATRGRLEGAREALAEALQIFAQARDVSGITLLLDDFSQLEAAEGRAERAIRLSGAAAALRASSGAELAEVVRTRWHVFQASEQTSKELAEAAFAKGLQMTSEEAVAYALEAPG